MNFQHYVRRRHGTENYNLLHITNDCDNHIWIFRKNSLPKVHLPSLHSTRKTVNPENGTRDDVVRCASQTRFHLLSSTL
jgi:hypothetical protein